jgi:hypothetical protein
VQKIPPYLSQHSQHDFQPHQGFSFLDSVNNLEKQALQDKLIGPAHSNDYSRDLQADEADENGSGDGSLDSCDRVVVVNTSDFVLQPSSLNSQGRRELMKALEKEGKCSILNKNIDN